MSRFSTKTKAIAAGVLIPVAIAFIYIYFRYDPASSPLFPRCLFLTLTGWQCPGCGSQRAIHALLHADPAAAWRANPLLIVLLPVIIAAIYAETAKGTHPRLHRLITSPPAILLLLTALIAFTIARNLG